MNIFKGIGTVCLIGAAIILFMLFLYEFNDRANLKVESNSEHPIELKIEPDEKKIL